MKLQSNCKNDLWFCCALWAFIFFGIVADDGIVNQYFSRIQVFIKYLRIQISEFQCIYSIHRWQNKKKKEEKKEEWRGVVNDSWQ
jgi:hypothetical protein